MDIYTHATGQTDDLAVSVAALEVHCAHVFARPVLDLERLQRAIRITWPQIITDAQNARVSPQVEYVASLSDLLVKEMNLIDPGVFTDRTDVPWLEYYTAGCGDELRCEDAWVIAELFWGGYRETAGRTHPVAFRPSLQSEPAPPFRWNGDSETIRFRGGPGRSGACISRHNPGLRRTGSAICPGIPAAL